MNEFTNSRAQEHAEQGSIEAWIHDYLQNEGNNVPLSDGNHRIGALEKLGCKRCSVLIWDDAGAEHIRIGDAEE